MGEYSHIIDDMTWSFSRLESFEQCPFAWVNSYIYGEEKRNNFFSDFGSCMHCVLSEYFNREIGKEDLIVRYIELFSQIKSRAPTQKIKDGRFRDGLSYLSSPLSTFYEFDSREIISAEREFNISLDGLPFTGFVDLESHDTEFVVTDHKSSVIKPPSGRAKKTAYDLERERKARQLYIYAYAFHDKYGFWPDRLEFNCYRVPYFVSIKFSEAEMEETIRWAHETAKTISSADIFGPNIDQYYCRNICSMASCPYRDML